MDNPFEIVTGVETVSVAIDETQLLQTAPRSVCLIWVPLEICATGFSAAGAADPRLEINDVYNTLDADGVRRGYLVDAISLTVNQVREPHADVRVELRRLD